LWRFFPEEGVEIKIWVLEIGKTKVWMAWKREMEILHLAWETSPKIVFLGGEAPTSLFGFDP
jgi:hypothetical protein